jgi:polar amino acid transport system substrate-binding protein
MIQIHKRVIPIVLVLGIGMIGSSCKPSSQAAAADRTPTTTGSVYDRVLQSGTIRAAYISYPPALMRDTRTGQMSGIFVETLEKAAENLGLKVQWTEEVGWGSQIEGLEANRYDIVGSPVWANPTRGKLTTLSAPVYYSGIGVYVRADDHRFDNGLSGINSANVRIGTIDGETGDLIARTQFPLARRVSLPQTADISELFLQITTNKADIIFAEPYFGHQFLASNPNSVRNVAAARPIKVLGNVYMFRKGEEQLKQMLDVAIEDLINSGYVDQLLAKYEPAPGTFYRVSYPYRSAP